MKYTQRMIVTGNVAIRKTGQRRKIKIIFGKKYAYIDLRSAYNMHLISHFSENLAAGHVLCVMPISRVLIEDFIVDPIPGYVFCPPDSIEMSDLNVVWEPASAWPHERQLGWAKAAATQISIKDLASDALVAFTVDFIDWDAFLDGDHDFHLDTLRRAAEQAEYVMDLIRLDYCRMDLPDTLPGRVSMLGNGIPFSCGAFYTLQDHEAYLIAGQVMQVARVGGIGLDCSGIGHLTEVPNGETGNIARQGLSLFTQALEANYLSTKFSQCFVTLEFLASPDTYEQMKKVKTKIGAHVAKDRTSYNEFCEEIRFLSEDIRTRIVHQGCSFESIVPDKKEREKIFRKLQRYIGVTLEQMIINGKMTWEEFTSLRDNRLRDLGVK